MGKGILLCVGRNGIITIWDKIFLEHESKSLNIFFYTFVLELFYLGYFLPKSEKSE